MREKVRKSLNEGVRRVKWIATFLAERTRAETSSAKFLYESSKLENRMDELYKDIGKRVLNLNEKGDKAVLKDLIIQQAIDEIKSMREVIEDHKNKARNFSKLPE